MNSSFWFWFWRPIAETLGVLAAIVILFIVVVVFITCVNYYPKLKNWFKKGKR